MTEHRKSSFDKITDNINDLTQPYTHREHLTPLAQRLHRTIYYEVQHPSLLTQLRAAIHPTIAEIDLGGGAFGSRPPTNTDALNALMRIESAAAWWLKIEYGRDLRGNCEDNLRALIGASTEPHRTRDQLADLATDTSHWLTWARTESGWQPRPITVRDPCPAPICDSSRKPLWAGYCNDHTNTPEPCPPDTCGRRESIRVRRPDANHAWCTHCGAAWSEDHPELPSVLLLVDALLAARGAA